MRRRLSVLGCLAWCLSASAWATDVTVVGVVGKQALVVVNGSAPHLMAVGSDFEGVHLMAVGSDDATLVIDGRRETLRLGQLVGGAATQGQRTAVLVANSNGAFTALGSINGRAITFLADTGATLVVLSAAEADRLGIAWRTSPTQLSQTANGTVPFHHVVLASVQVGEIVLNSVDAAVQEVGLGSGALLGQSFLNRTDMTRSGTTMTLTKRF